MTVENEILGVLAQAEVIDSGKDSNYGRLLTETAQRLFNTRLFKRAYILHRPIGTGVEYPNVAILPGEPPESEYTNMTNANVYTATVALSTIGTAKPWEAIFQLLAIREIALEACRTKAKIEMKPGDLHENTTIISPAFVVPENEGGVWTYSTGFYVNYLITEPRKEE